MFMSAISSLLKFKGLAPALEAEEAKQIAAELKRLSGLRVYPTSIACQDGVIYFLGHRGIDKNLCLLYPAELARLSRDFFGQEESGSIFTEIQIRFKSCATDHANALALRKHLLFTAPEVVGVKRSVGLGDRLGIATPGHIRAVRGTQVIPFFPQQSIREMTRTSRTPDEVMDDATWGVFQEGFRGGFGSDADHLKTTEDMDSCIAAGFTMFTIDPGDYVDNEADTCEASIAKEKFEALPWEQLESSPADCQREYAGKALVVAQDLEFKFTEETLFRAAVKYGRAVAHTVKLYRHLAEKMSEKSFELEMSVDETATPTAIEEHFFVASELKRLGVKWVSLAPRFIGDFEKAVDYKGDLNEFERTFKEHLAIARHFGPYKLSIHSGSDKFSIYPIVAEEAGELVHLKTAGTSYLEALRVIASKDAGLFREILDFAFTRWEEDRATYHVSADLSKVTRPQDLKDEDLAKVLDQFDGRQLLHCTFGSVLTWKNADGSYRFRDRLLLTLRQNEEAYYDALKAHLGRHIAPFNR